ncbi:MAG: hypothetical protein RLP15_07205 [Cryomorphaceae bacterium]
MGEIDKEFNCYEVQTSEGYSGYEGVKCNFFGIRLIGCKSELAYYDSVAYDTTFLKQTARRLFNECTNKSEYDCVELFIRPTNESTREVNYVFSLQANGLRFEQVNRFGPSVH